MERFKAQAQFGDWNGTVQADEADQKSLHSYLVEKNLMSKDEFLLAITFYSSEKFLSIHAFVTNSGSRYEAVNDYLQNTPDPISVREIELELKAEEFLEFFKRFSMVLTWRDLPLEDREYRVTNR